MAPVDSLKVEAIGGVTVVNFGNCTELDELNTQSVGDQLGRLVDQNNRDRLHLDFAGVEYLSSSMLGKLVAVHKRLQTGGGRLVVFNVRPLVYEVFAITRLTGFLDVRAG